jgi:hypothetical protein
MSELVSESSILVKITKDAYLTPDGLVFNGVEIDDDSFKSIRNGKFFVIKFETDDTDIMFTEIKRGVVFRIFYDARFAAGFYKGLNKEIIIASFLEHEYPQGIAIVEYLSENKTFKGLGLSNCTLI